MEDITQKKYSAYARTIFHSQAYLQFHKS